jgi:hypothetical protein
VLGVEVETRTGRGVEVVALEVLGVVVVVEVSWDTSK